MTQMILCSLKLADSWSTLNSFFGNNSKHKPKSDDDSRLFKIFKQWQVCSKSILDCSLVVIQNLKSCIRKTEKPTNNISIKSTSEINPFKNIKNLQFNSDKYFFQSDPTAKENDSSSSKENARKPS
ncbi:hypothetical protein LSTR_LSTR001604 [Laodelphax striatellus]|uniref:Uncharacterized protein n=1 Tax=Laodelphax striatellus TaxID=195883 RepID=A0A482XCC8_LAOST|nr:hypothetical protein LSTR_LSTR001604 [Laodelphax striatellus]